MNLKLEFEFSKADILKEVAALKKQVDDMRPLPADVEGRVMQKLRLDWNYNSNAIEGNKLSYGETMALLQHGITAKGKPLKDHLDIQGHNAGIDFLLAMIKDERPITETDIRSLHEIILMEPYQTNAETPDESHTSKLIKLGQYKTLPNHVKTLTGDIHYYSSPEETPAKMEELMEWYYEVIRFAEISPIVVAALFHHKFVAIHPFDDGNGRVARILMNLILMDFGYPPVVIKQDDKQNYYSLLSQADVGDSWPFVEYIVDRLQSSIQLYIKAANGNDIEEDEDIDKQIALFKRELQGKINLTDQKTAQSVNKVVNNVIKPLIQKIVDKVKDFDELFFTSDKFLRYRYYIKGNPTSLKEGISQNIVKTVTKNIKDNDYNKLEFHCEFKNFRQSDKMFNVNITLDIFFESFKYSVCDMEANKLIEKYYHEDITKQEVQKIILSFIILLKDKIEKSL